MSRNYQLTQCGGLKQGANPDDIIRRFEKVNTSIFEEESSGARYVAKQIADTIVDKQLRGEKCVLGLSTGNSPIDVYKELVDIHRAKKLSFSNVVIFSLDEFYPIDPSNSQSRNHSIHEYLLNHVDIRPENIHVPDSSIPLDKVSEYCRKYEAQIAIAGGIELMLLGTGEQGQVGFNEPGSHLNSHTRLVALGNKTRKGLANLFSGAEKTPVKAITMGLSTIFSARRVILIAWGESKAQVISRIVEGDPTLGIPASSLQNHPNIEIVVDKDAAIELVRESTPWLVGECDWQLRFIRKAVLWLSMQVGKPILKLTSQDYTDNSLGQMLEQTGCAFDAINIQVFNDLQHTISGWPAGKPNADDTTRPERSSPYPKRVVVFSPHPDDDVISMGGTLLRLVDQGHQVHVAYQTSGNIAVHDNFVEQVMDTATECGFIDNYAHIKQLMASKKAGEPEPAELCKLKGSIRRAEAKAACRHFGINDHTNVHFLNLPFYETGGVKKGELSQADIEIVANLLRTIQPHQIYAAGDLSDPHGTHRVCIEAVLGALETVQGESWLKDCRMWLYRGAWQEWELDMVDMAVPLSPDEVIKKRHAIYRHMSQKDIVPFPGEDKREFWERAEERTQNTANQYNQLGMAEYQAIEVFVKLF